MPSSTAVRSWPILKPETLIPVTELRMAYNEVLVPVMPPVIKELSLMNALTTGGSLFNTGLSEKPPIAIEVSAPAAS